MIDIDFHPDDGRARGAYEALVADALSDVVDVFARVGLRTEADPVHRAVFLTARNAALELVSSVFDIPVDRVPDTLCGTPHGETLYMCTEELVEPILQRLYPTIPWDGTHEYFECVKHEIAHMVHEKLAIQIGGSADAMGPVWFFESLAILVARQFPSIRRTRQLAPSELREIIERSEREQVSYLDFARVGYSLAEEFELSTLVHAAAAGELPQLLADYRST